MGIVRAEALALGVAISLGGLVAQGSSPDRQVRVARANPDPRLAILIAEDRRLALPPDLHTPAIDALRYSLDEDARLLVELTRSSDRTVAQLALRALGRYERREFVPVILPFLPLAESPGAAATALAQALRGPALAADVAGEQVRAVQVALIDTGVASLAAPPPLKYSGLIDIARALGRLPYANSAEVEAADDFLRKAVRHIDGEEQAVRAAIMPSLMAAFEQLARVQARIAPPGVESIEDLRRIATDVSRYGAEAATGAMAALAAARGLDDDTLSSIARAPKAPPEMRRLTALALASAGSPITGQERTAYLANLLADGALMVRIEALRGWARTQVAEHGCWRLLDTLKDPDVPLALVAIDLLGDTCKEDQSVTDRLTAEARTPPDAAWHAEAHALVALAKRAPDRGRAAMPAFAKHARWQVRMYAARAAAIAGDLATLERLAYDVEANVREAVLPRLRALRGAASDPHFVAALGMADYQLLRTAANELKGSKPTPELVVALVEALKRVTAERKETSRDTRLALLERIDELAPPDQAGQLVPLLRDYDVEVAVAGAAILQKWTGERQEIDPQLLPRPSPPRAGELADMTAKYVRVKLSSGKILRLHLRPDVAPLTSTRFYRLVNAGYFTGLTFHRIVPNFIIQGGSPGANEYAGDALYERDEIGRLSNERGTVGLSTRGRDTGDAQFYFNLVNNPRLDYEYTVFATVGNMEDVERILEGETIQSISFEEPDKK